MMELGATLCLPRAPRCAECPVAGFCEARKTGRQNELPVKRARPASHQISVRLALLEQRGAVLMRQRPAEASLMPGFWEFPAPEDLTGWQEAEFLGSFHHTITHHHYTVTVLHGKISRAPAGFEWRRRDALEAIPLTTISKKALRLLGRVRLRYRSKNGRRRRRRPRTRRSAPHQDINPLVSAAAWRCLVSCPWPTSPLQATSAGCPHGPTPVLHAPAMNRRRALSRNRVPTLRRNLRRFGERFSS